MKLLAQLTHTLGVVWCFNLRFCRESAEDFDENDDGIRFYPMKRTWKDDETGRVDSKKLTQAFIA